MDQSRFEKESSVKLETIIGNLRERLFKKKPLLAKIVIKASQIEESKPSEPLERALIV